MLLTGSFDAKAIADHAIVAKGLVLEPQGMDPLRLEIQKVGSVGAACAQTCTLEPPGARGIHGKERPGKEGGVPGVINKPGTEGGTPGAVSPPPPHDPT